MIKISCVCLVALAIGSVVSVQKEIKPWTEWSKKDVQKILNDSAWGQTQLETLEASSSTGAITSTAAPLNRNAAQPAPGAVTSSIRYFIRFLSARPIRQAVVRKVQLEQPSLDPAMAERLRAFVEMNTSDFIVIAVSAEASDKQMGGSAIQAFTSANMESLKDVTYLERKDGQRLPLADFKAPGNDGLGAKFVFPRMLNDQPFMNGDAEQVRFYCRLSKTIKLAARFKVSEMVYDGKLEY
jgi:hypothetical protein